MTVEELATKNDFIRLEKKIEGLFQGIPSTAPKWVRREEAAKILGVGYDTLTKLKAEGKIRSAKTDRIIFYNIPSLYEHLDCQSATF